MNEMHLLTRRLYLLLLGILVFVWGTPGNSPATIVYTVDQTVTTDAKVWPHAVAEAGDYQIGMAWIEVKSGNAVPVEVFRNSTRVRAFYAPVGEVTRFEMRLEGLAKDEKITVKVSPDHSTYRIGYQIALGTPTFDGLPVFNVADYGAVGDGTTDDAQAIHEAVFAARDAGGGTVRFDHTKTFRVRGGGWTFDLDGARNIRIVGRNPNNPDQRAKLLLESPTRVTRILKAENIHIDGFIVDYDPLPYWQAEVVGADPTNWTVDVRVFDRYPIPETGEGGFTFGRIFLPDGPGSRSGTGAHLWVSKVERIPGGSARDLRIHANLEGRNMKSGEATKEAVRKCANGEVPEVIMRTRNSTTDISYTVVLEESARVLLSNIRFYRVPKQTITPQDSHGPVTFRNIDMQMPDATEDPVFNRETELFYSWRGNYLSPNNRFGILIEDCEIDSAAMYDDVFAIFMRANEVRAVSGDTITVSRPGGTTVGNQVVHLLKPGDWVSVWTPDQSALKGMVRILNVGNISTDETTFDVTLESLPQGPAVGDAVLYEELLNRNSVIRRCRTTRIGTSQGSNRFRCVNLLIQNCHFDDLHFYIHKTDGPRPRDIVFDNVYNHDMDVGYVNLDDVIGVKFKNCTFDNTYIDMEGDTRPAYLDAVKWINMSGDILNLRDSEAWIFGDSSRNGSAEDLSDWVKTDASSTIHFSAPPTKSSEAISR
ncbi:hypothetical protein HQ520_15450 [bacterium]|nr:hypothetical protein [bacterium]